MDFLEKLQKENEYLQTMKKHGLVDGKQTLSVDLDPKAEEHEFKVENMSQEESKPEEKVIVEENSPANTGDTMNNDEFNDLKNNFEKMAKFIMEFQKIKNEEIRSLHEKIENMSTVVATMESKMRNMSSGMSPAQSVNTAPSQPTQASTQPSSQKVTKPQSRSGDLTPDSIDLGSFFYAGK